MVIGAIKEFMRLDGDSNYHILWYVILCSILVQGVILTLADSGSYRMDSLSRDTVIDYMLAACFAASLPMITSSAINVILWKLGILSSPIDLATSASDAVLHVALFCTGCGVFFQGRDYRFDFLLTWVTYFQTFMICAVNANVMMFSPQNIRNFISSTGVILAVVISQIFLCIHVSQCEKGSSVCDTDVAAIIAEVFGVLALLLLMWTLHKAGMWQCPCESNAAVSPDALTTSVGRTATTKNTNSEFPFYISGSLMLLTLIARVAITAASAFDDALNRRQFSVLLIGNIVISFSLACFVPMLIRKASKSSLSALQKRIEFKDTFVRYISHEIRSPLSTATLGLDYLVGQMEEHKISMEEILEIVRDTKTATEIATSTMSDLLMFDKLNNNMLELDCHLVNGWAFASKCVIPFRTQANISHLSFSFQSDGNGMTKKASLYIDKFKIEQVIRNFLTNAFKFTPANGLLQVRVGWQRRFTNNPLDLYCGTEGVLRVSVTDTGPGISANNLKLLFGQYVQFDANKLQKGKGSGLGLWLSKSIIQLHGGYIGAISPGEGRGCTFYFELPCCNPYAVEQLNSLTSMNDVNDVDDQQSVKSFVNTAAATAAAVAASGVESIQSVPSVSKLGATDSSIDSNSVLEGAKLAQQEQQYDNLEHSFHDMVHHREDVRSSSGATTAVDPISGRIRIPGASAGGASYRSASTVVAHVAAPHSISSASQTPIDDNRMSPTPSTGAEGLTSDNRSVESSSNNSTEAMDNFGNDTGYAVALRAGAPIAETVPLGGHRLAPLRELERPRHSTTSQPSAPSSIHSNSASNSIHSSAPSVSVNSSAPSVSVHSSARSVSAGRRSNASRNSRNSRTPPPPQTQLKLLIADDAPLARRMVERALSSLHRECHHANNGLEAVKKVDSSLQENKPYDVIIIDYYMPVMNGDEAIRQIRELGFNGFIIAATGSTSAEDHKNLTSFGADVIMLKPITLTAFLAVLQGGER